MDEPSDCLNCDAGYYGETTGLEVSTCTGKCAPGYYCPAGSTTHSPVATRCRAGTFCEEGSFAEEPCAPGTYNPNEGQRECLDCPAGYFCIEGDPDVAVTHEPQECAAGHYCIEKTGTQDGTQCERGFYQPETGHWKCLQCPPGYFCSTLGKTSISTLDYCDPGYYCKGLSKTATPIGISEGDKCEIGYYCDQGSAFMKACPPGLACPNEGMQLTDAQAQLCDPGFYCLGGATTV